VLSFLFKRATVTDSPVARAEFKGVEEFPLKLTVKLDVSATLAYKTACVRIS
jgi:hypothetical protein